MEDLPFTCPARVQRRAVIYDSMRRVRKRKATRRLGGSNSPQTTTGRTRLGTASSHGRCTRLADRPRVFRLPLAGCADSHRVASPCAQNSARSSSGRAAVRGSGSRVAGSAVCVREDERGTAIKLLECGGGAGPVQRGLERVAVKLGRCDQASPSLAVVEYRAHSDETCRAASVVGIQDGGEDKKTIASGQP